MRGDHVDVQRADFLHSLILFLLSEKEDIILVVNVIIHLIM